MRLTKKQLERRLAESEFDRSEFLRQRNEAVSELERVKKRFAEFEEAKPTVIVDGPGVYETVHGGRVILDHNLRNPHGYQWREDGTGTETRCLRVVRKIDAMPETIPKGYRLTSPPQFEDPNGRPFLSVLHSKPTVLKTNNIVRSINEGRRWIVEPIPTQPTLEQLGKKIAELVKAFDELKGKTDA